MKPLTLASLGTPKDVAEKMMGSHWTLKVWKDANIWGFYLTCRELPLLNILETFLDGIEKEVDHPMFGGKAKVSWAKGQNTPKPVTYPIQRFKKVPYWKLGELQKK